MKLRRVQGNASLSLKYYLLSIGIGNCKADDYFHD